MKHKHYIKAMGKPSITEFTGKMVQYARSEAEQWCLENNIHPNHHINARIEAWCLYVRGKNIKQALSTWWIQYRNNAIGELEKGLFDSA
jgi:hypothetical protein